MNTHFETGSILTFTLMSLVAILFLIVWSLILAWPVQLLWNWLAPTIFGQGMDIIKNAGVYKNARRRIKYRINKLKNKPL